MLISIHVHIGNPFGFLLFCYITLFILPTCVFVLFVVVFFTEELVPTGPCTHFHLHDINCRCWGAWAFGKPGCSGPQNHPFLAPLVQFASAPPIFQTSCPHLSLP